MCRRLPRSGDSHGAASACHSGEQSGQQNQQELTGTCLAAPPCMGRLAQGLDLLSEGCHADPQGHKSGTVQTRWNVQRGVHVQGVTMVWRIVGVPFQPSALTGVSLQNTFWPATTVPN